MLEEKLNTLASLITQLTNALNQERLESEKLRELLAIRDAQLRNLQSSDGEHSEESRPYTDCTNS